MHKKSIHRVLVFRLALVAIILSIILGTTVVIFEFNSIYERVAERSLSAVEHLRWLMIDELGSKGFNNSSNVKQIMQKMASASIKTSEGTFVLARILDLNFNEVASLVDNKYEHIGEVLNYAKKNLDRVSLVKKGYWHGMDFLDDVSLIYLGKGLDNAQNSRVGYVEGIYVISPSFIAKARWSAVFTSLGIIGIVLLTTILIYPVIIQLFRRISKLSSSLLDANMELLNVLGGTIAKRDRETDAHNYRVTIYAVRTAEVLQLDPVQVRALIKGAFLHDVGKIGISDSILLKPGKLTNEEFEEMKKHVSIGNDIALKSTWLADALDVINYHHERYDGAGYNAKKQGTEIPEIARIFAVADVFDAITSKRPYKEPMSFEDAVEILENGSGTHFDPVVLNAFLSIARSLYDEYANRDDAKIRDDVSKLALKYFSPDVVDALTV